MNWFKSESKVDPNIKSMLDSNQMLLFFFTSNTETTILLIDLDNYLEDHYINRSCSCSRSRYDFNFNFNFNYESESESESESKSESKSDNSIYLEDETNFNIVKYTSIDNKLWNKELYDSSGKDLYIDLLKYYKSANIEKFMFKDEKSQKILFIDYIDKNKDSGCSSEQFIENILDEFELGRTFCCCVF